MKQFLHLKILIIGIALITSCENQELLTLNEPFSSHFGFFPEHQADDLSVALTEHHPLFLYASSQNQFSRDHFQVPQNQFTEHFRHKEQPTIHSSNNNAKPREARQQFYGSSFLNEQRNTNNNNRHSKTDHPPLTYGFVPRIQKSTADRQQPNSKIAYNTLPEQRNNNFRNNANNERNQQQSFHSPAFRAENTQGQHFRRNKQFSENGRAVFSHDQHESANLALTKIQNDHSKISSSKPSAQNFASNAFNPQFSTSGRQHELRNHNLNAENIEESVRQHTIYVNNEATEKNNKDHNRERNPVFRPNFVTRSQMDRNVRNRNQNENLNLYNNARRIPDHNKPQLPSRNPLPNNGVRTDIPEVIPVLHLGSSNSNAAGNSPPVYIRNTDSPESSASNDPEKKTYLVFKAPTQVTTEKPPSTSNSISDLGNLLSNIHTSEISYTTQLPTQQLVLPLQNVDNEAIILDLVQIPDSEAYAKNNDSVSEGSASTDHRISVNKARNSLENISDFKNNAGTTSADINEDEFYHHDEKYTTATEDYHQLNAQSVLDRVFPEYKKVSNVSFLPISYSSSISVAVDQGTNKKPQAIKNSKLTLKKALSQRKKPKLPENHDYIYSDAYGQQNVPGKPGIDYPTYGEIPFTNFDCRTFKAPGFYADLEAGCQVFHNCDMDMTKHSFMCPNGTIFHQELFICDWWYNVRCDDSPEYFSLNSGLFATDQHHKDSLKQF